jgi:phage terminase large subunit-like protein
VTRGQQAIAWIERYCVVPEGKLVGQPVKLRPWQKKIIRGIYDSLTRTAIVSFGRKNGKTALASCLLLLHLCGPEALANSQLCSAAQSRDQASLLFSYAAKMIRRSPDLAAECTIRDSFKEILCPALGTVYNALSADASTNLGKSPAFIVHDELGQVKGPRSDLYEALETGTGAHERPLSVVISTQAPTDGDLLSILIDDAQRGEDPTTKVWLWTADPDLDPFSAQAKKQANPALGDFLSRSEVDKQAENARRMPARESSYRNLVLNQRVETRSPFVSRLIWKENGRPQSAELDGREVFAGLDLSAVSDLTALVAMAAVEGEAGEFDVESRFWLPDEGLEEKSRADRVPYDVWRDAGMLVATPGRTVEYEFVASELWDLAQRCTRLRVAFDTYNMRFLKPWLQQVGFTDEQIDGQEGVKPEEDDIRVFFPFRQGFVSMGPALRALEALLLGAKLRHGDHPVLTMCAANARTIEDPARNRKFVKSAPTARIDGMVSLAMAASIAQAALTPTGPSVYEERGLLVL